MDFYFVYSSGGGAGDWKSIDRIFKTTMPDYFKNHILIKFGDIFFNHRSGASIKKPKLWKDIDNAKSWLIKNTNDSSLQEESDMIMDVGTTKIVSYLTSLGTNSNAMQLIARFDRIMYEEGVLEKYSDVIKKSKIHNAVTFDIPNLFKVRSQLGNIQRNLFDEAKCAQQLISSCADYANYIYEHSTKTPDDLLTIVNINWAKEQIQSYFKKLKYKPTKLAIGGAAFYHRSDFATALQNLNKVIKLKDYKRVHFLGCGGLERAKIIKTSLGNLPNFSVDNTTPYNRGIDGNTKGSTRSGYFDYMSGGLIRIDPNTIKTILQCHKTAGNNAYFSMEEMKTILKGILQHQSGNSSPDTYECRAKLIIHNFDVFKYRAQLDL